MIANAGGNTANFIMANGVALVDTNYPNNGQGDWFKRIDLGPGWNPMTAIL